jgi:hypothetical protein
LIRGELITCELAMRELVHVISMMERIGPA